MVLRRGSGWGGNPEKTRIIVDVQVGQRRQSSDFGRDGAREVVGVEIPAGAEGLIFQKEREERREKREEKRVVSWPCCRVRGVLLVCEKKKGREGRGMILKWSLFLLFVVLDGVEEGEWVGRKS